MKKTLIILVALLVLAFSASQLVYAQQNADCTTIDSGDMTPLTSISVPLTCEADQIVYFGACDSGPVPNDDEFEMVFNGAVVSRNGFVDGREYVDIGSALVTAGEHEVTLRNLANRIPYATYTYAISTDRQMVEATMREQCGADFVGIGIPTIAGCLRSVPVFTEDTAPSAGRVELRVQYGEMARVEGYLLRSWTLEEGERINNDYALVNAPKYVRVWWQPEGNSTWFLLPSQYWQGGTTLASEYGVSCDNKGVPSYHTSFANAISETAVPAVPALR